MNSAGMAHTYLNVEHHSGSELGTKGDLLLPYLQQLRPLLPSLQAPVLCQTCTVQSILAIPACAPGAEAIASAGGPSITSMKI